MTATQWAQGFSRRLAAREPIETSWELRRRPQRPARMSDKSSPNTVRTIGKNLINANLPSTCLNTNPPR